MTSVAGAVALLLSIGLLCARRIGTMLPLCAVQGVCAGAALGRASMMAALLAVALNGVALPLLLARTDDGAPTGVRGDVLLSWVTVFLLLAATDAAFAAVGVGVAALGLMLAILRTHALAPAIGLLSAQNGAALVAAGQGDHSLPTVVAIAVPLLSALALADHWLRSR